MNEFPETTSDELVRKKGVLTNAEFFERLEKTLKRTNGRLLNGASMEQVDPTSGCMKESQIEVEFSIAGRAVSQLSETGVGIALCQLPGTIFGR